MKHIQLDSVDSTNSYVSAHVSDFDAPVMVSTREQTEGRGQRGNSWEAEPGKNLLFSVLWRFDGFPAMSQFAISQAVAMSIVCALQSETGIMSRVKWPNDIYVDNLKIAGILIEHSVTGKYITHSVAGAGINLNQERFLSSAPNPVSVFNITGAVTDVERFRKTVADNMEGFMEMVMSPEGRKELDQLYISALWRGNGMISDYRDTVTGEFFRASIEGVESTGHLLLRETYPGNKLRRYAFKEVEAIL